MRWDAGLNGVMRQLFDGVGEQTREVNGNRGETHDGTVPACALCRIAWRVRNSGFLHLRERPSRGIADIEAPACN